MTFIDAMTLTQCFNLEVGLGGYIGLLRILIASLFINLQN